MPWAINAATFKLSTSTEASLIWGVQTWAIWRMGQPLLSSVLCQMPGRWIRLPFPEGSQLPTESLEINWMNSSGNWQIIWMALPSSLSDEARWNGTAFYPLTGVSPSRTGSRRQVICQKLQTVILALDALVTKLFYLHIFYTFLSQCPRVLWIQGKECCEPLISQVPKI